MMAAGLSEQDRPQTWTLASTAGLTLTVTSAYDTPVFRDFFEGYDKAFILPTEKEQESGLKACLDLNRGEAHKRLSETYGPFTEVVLIARDSESGLLVGGANLIGLQFLDSSGTPVVTSNLNYVYTSPEARGKGYFRRFLAAIEELVAGLFPHTEERRPLLFIEQNDPFKMTEEAYSTDTEHGGIDQFDRLLVWAKAGARVLDFDYVQPSLSPGQDADDTLVYTVLDPSSDTLDPALLAAHLERFFAISVFKGEKVHSDAARAQLADLSHRAQQGQRLIIQNPLPLLAARAQRRGKGLERETIPVSLRAALPRILTGVSPTIDRAVYWTLSLHIDNDRLKEIRGAEREGHESRSLFEELGGSFLSEQPNRTAIKAADERLTMQRRNQEKFPATSELIRAMEPMFNDVADRERLGIVEDYMLAIASREDAPAATDREVVSFTLDSARIAWQTEGLSFQAELPELPSQHVEIRRFWYVHSNCSVSYHVSFAINGYERTPAFLFFLSMLQKLVAPKEFLLPASSGIENLTATSAPDLTPFQAIRVSSHRGELCFWQFFAHLFDRDFTDFHDRLLDRAAQPGEDETQWWNKLVLSEPYVEVPGLRMPRVRSNFYIADSLFRDMMLPRGDDGRPAKLMDMLSDDFCGRALAHELGKECPGAVDSGPRTATNNSIHLRAPFWLWLRRNHQEIIKPEWRTANPNIFAKLVELASYGPKDADGGSLALCYLFLAGFTQNIIDFLNQDALDVLDSLDPIYPSESDDAAEGFLVRYSNSRTLFTFVAKMRSLEIGTRYIGTCPYAFLIHALTLQNEFLTRDFERRAADVLNEVEVHARNEHFSEAARKFYKFRRNSVAEYDTCKNANVFRYDTESKTFLYLDSIRGISLKRSYVDELVVAADLRTRDLEKLITRNDEKQLNLLVAFIGVFSVLQVIFQATESSENILLASMGIFSWIYVTLIFFSIAAVLYAFWLYLKIRKRRREQSDDP